jgi:hypothetical protein
VTEDPLDVAARLAQLGIAVEDLREAVIGGYLARATCTANDPPSFPGMVFWGVTTRILREQLMAKGWVKSDAGNYSIVISPNSSIDLVVATGDEATGNAAKMPKTNYPKGPATVAAVLVNRSQIDLFSPTGSIHPAAARGPITWVLLIAHTGERGARAELSLPLEIGDDGRIEAWRERIILPPLDDDGGEAARREAEGGPEFDVAVSRRAG